MAKIIRTLFKKLNLPEQETEVIVEKIKERNMGQLFENFEKVDIQLERQLRAEAEQRAAEAEQCVAVDKLLTKRLIEENRIDDLLKALQNDGYKEQLRKELHI